MPEIVECLGSAEASSERADPATQARNGPLSGLAQVRLEFAERHLDRIRPFTGPWESCDSIRQEHALGLARSVPPDMEVMPVYARFSTSSAGLQALIAECRFDGVRNRDSPAVLSDASPQQVRLLTIPKDVAVGF
jgi:hypothetical protein